MRTFRIFSTVIKVLVAGLIIRNASAGPLHLERTAAVTDETLDVEQMSTDYRLVAEGAEPKFATRKSGELADGGSSFYRGKGYSLQKLKTLGHVAGQNGFFYGPAVKLNQSSTTISHVEFYSANSLAKLTSNSEKGVVPSEDTAIKIAETVVVPIYGDKVLAARPFKATLSEGVWTVNGTLAKGLIGGVPTVQIAKRDGAILKVTHSK